MFFFFFFFQAEDGIRDLYVTGVQTCALPILLEYLAPRDGRPLPTDERANDLSHWQTTVRVADLEAAARAARGSGLGWISPGPISVAEQQLGFSRALLARDPDGHVVQLSVAVTNDARSTR